MFYTIEGLLLANNNVERNMLYANVKLHRANIKVDSGAYSQYTSRSTVSAAALKVIIANNYQICINC